MPISFAKIAGFLALLSATGCMSVVAVRPAESRGQAVPVERSSGRGGGSGGGRGSLGIPPGHLPRAGQCRLWYPGRPPGQQPKAGDCAAIQRSAPAGSWVLYRPASDAKVVHNRVIDSRRTGVVVEVRVYDADRGTYIRAEGRQR